jgi:hypothetical protein
LHAFPGARQNIVGDRRLSGGSPGRRRSKRGLQSANRAVERQPVCLQNVGGQTAPVAHNRGKNDSAIDVPASAAPRRRSGRFEDAPHVRRDAEAGRRLVRIDARLRELPHHIRLERRDINVAGVQHRDGVRIVAERRQQMLERDIGRTGASRELGPARQRRAKIRRHRNLSEVSGGYAHDISRPAVKNSV